jgi:hypothetical protein
LKPAPAAVIAPPTDGRLSSSALVPVGLDIAT